MIKVKRGLLSLLLAVVALQCSGCATILGGIIGYQSAELCAGLAIGAAIDFSGDIARGIGQMTAKEQNFCRDFNQNVSLDANKGELKLPICPFDRRRTSILVARLQDTFIQNGWSYLIIEKNSNKPLFGPERWNEKWKCTIADQEPFELEIKFMSDRDTVFRILDGSQEKRAEYINLIYQWLQNSICTSGAA